MKPPPPPPPTSQSLETLADCQLPLFRIPLDVNVSHLVPPSKRSYGLVVCFFFRTSPPPFLSWIFSAPAICCLAPDFSGSPVCFFFFLQRFFLLFRRGFLVLLCRRLVLLSLVVIARGQRLSLAYPLFTRLMRFPRQPDGPFLFPDIPLCALRCDVSNQS